MTAPADARQRAIAAVLAGVMEREAVGRSIVGWRIAPSSAGSSARLSDIEIELDRGEVLRLILKGVGRRDRLPGAPSRLARGLRDPRREIAVYERLLADADLDTPRLYASVQDPAVDRFWLFLERIEGTELRWAVEPAMLPSVATWLARAHKRLSHVEAAGVPLVRHDAAYYRRWLDRARRADLSVGGSRRQALAWIARHYGSVVDTLTALPQTVIHGEFYPSNIVVDDSRPDGRIAVVDWEMAGIGPAVIDLAALVAGRYPEDVRRSMLEAYRSTIPTAQGAWRDATEDEPLLYARLHLAIQWLGWARGWSPPAEQRHDWLAEAIEIGERLGW
jgi:aminoglycoside phosphotransferase (APT) family kinase protein